MTMNIRNGHVLLPSGEIRGVDLRLAEGLIQEIGTTGTGGKTIDAKGKLVLPGIVDLHGDGFERHIMPRAGVSFKRSLGLLDTDRTMTANGITTAFHGLTCSWEPGLRSRDAAQAFMKDFASLRDRLGCDTRLHLRFETYNLPAMEEVHTWMRQGLVDMLAFNDHIDAMFTNLDRYSKMSGYLDRTGLNREEFIELITEIKGRAGAVPKAISRLAGTAREQGIPMASHDDPDQETRAWYNSMGCAISEFPLDENTARAARDMGNAVILGAPNALRGKSHINRLMARDAIQMGLCDALTSDYYYPSLLQAAFTLAAENVCTFPEAWNLVSAGPAKAVGLQDRAAIEPGKRADLIIVDHSDPDLPFTVLTLRQGAPVFSSNGLAG
ncbi:MULTISPECIES: alpha-D-ribose 1-methylphosphonate 5-triphosphate diphosphatase [unclassified Pseudodesulfovibrio]|uniref:alpha-D-ribose 1-methylphosphonate 5-triphosphate diphosphatase n=1 Tax=unclassified Pseudodesulfovibrio TaxID=2661612 RepID=UPI000FEC102C|nr:MULTISPECIES: alpha-D-ribose 1-methylphosphonate 5-triphosphate diphosphatase [unclassified Pseudodesulfovibrio]MCJ2163199.1 alpha-D-ribose 1-methylphosphonate 5-triphosphate diphosphatase [Pseudodesulfovibrio sp. S3-i]RWU07183.1 alpha-D-ribose 1-methylphosphonate 5-triphosphate diphosphatase [Pseudodesulfovibrio sp. S3]